MHTEIVKKIIELPIAERVEIIEKVSRRVRNELRTNYLSEKHLILTSARVRQNIQI